ncbi:hypothetical protein [Frankia sp. AgB32]|uniref:hypothetical protein n=1 Tax=Frankia sp. AgB32 TaxID=631119 RepID=UPI00200D60A6|nr:hypothetical protein [Frankia sp. AgB32]MCK9895419.1 hypothetical protein [Frankia sp. AgB32]
MTDEDSTGYQNPYAEYSNSNENGWVGQQVNNNSGHIFTHISPVYHINEDDPPEKKQEVAVAYLRSGAPRPAEKILRDLLWNGHATAERAYYYVLSVLGARSVYEIDSGLIEEIWQARKICATDADGEWRDALEVVMGLLRWQPDQSGEEVEWDGQWQSLRVFDALPARRREEIGEHLTLVVQGRVREHLEAQARRRVLSERVRDDRVKRAWKFFELPPLEPRLYPRAPLAEQPPDRGAYIGGALFLLAGVGVLLASLWWTVVLAIPLLTGSGWVLMRHRTDAQARQLVDAADDLDGQLYRTLGEPKSPGHYVPNELVADLRRVVDEQFAAVRPHRRGNWPEQTAATRAYLKHRLVTQYGNSQRSADQVKWLARWYARRVTEPVAHPWQPRGRPVDDAVDQPNRDRDFWFGVLGSVLTLAILLAFGQIVAVPLLGAGAGWVVVMGRKAFIVRLAGTMRQGDEQRLLVEERQGLAEWHELLADRPSDTEMARWLAMDKAHIRYDAMDRAGLTDRDVVAHIIMTEGAKGANAARLGDGPLYYSSYLVRVFLLSRSGVREASAELDLLTGDVRNEKRNLFRYDALASARVRETGVRRTRAKNGQPTSSAKLQAVSFKLCLVNGEEIVSVSEALRRPESSLDEEEGLADLVLRTSGIESALRVLESVAAEGSDWIVRDQERRARWSHDLFGSDR